MSLSPVPRRELVRRLRRLGFSGPYAGAKHQFMERGAIRVRIPTPHRGNIGVSLLSEVLRTASVTLEEWEGA